MCYEMESTDKSKCGYFLVRWQQCCNGIDFLFVNEDVCDCFSWWLYAHCCLMKGLLLFENRCCGNAKHWSIESNGLLCFWQIKNDTLVGFFCFCGCLIKSVQFLVFSRNVYEMKSTDKCRCFLFSFWLPVVFLPWRCFLAIKFQNCFDK